MPPNPLLQQDPKADEPEPDRASSSSSDWSQKAEPDPGSLLFLPIPSSAWSEFFSSQSRVDYLVLPVQE